MLPESIRPIKHQTYKDRLDESLGMRRGPERNFRQSMADRRDESIGASLGRYGEPGLPSLAPRRNFKLNLPSREQRQALKQEVQPGTFEGEPPIWPQMEPPPSRLDLIKSKFAGTPREEAISGAINPVMPPPSQEAIEAAIAAGGIPSGISLPGEPELTPPVVDPIQEAVDAAVGGGRDPWENHLPSDHPFWQSPEFLAHQEKNKDFIGLTFLDPYPASDGTIFTDNLGEVGKLYDQWLINQQNQADPVQDAVDAAIGGGTTPQTGNKYGFIPPPPDAITTQALVPYYNPTTGETFTAGSGGWTAPEGWVHGNKPADWTPPTTDPVVGGETPVADEVSVMNQLQAMIDQILAQQAEQQTAQQQAQQQQAQQAQNYTLSGSRIGYNPYTSGQYQADPYGAAGVPDMGGLTTIPVPQPLTGIGYANYQAPENMT